MPLRHHFAQSHVNRSPSLKGRVKDSTLCSRHAEMLLQPPQRLLNHFALLAEGKAHEVRGLAVLEENTERYQRDSRLTHQTLAEHAVGFVCQAADVGREKIC